MNSPAKGVPEIALFVRAVKTLVPGAEESVDAPAELTGRWFVDFKLDPRGTVVVVEWRPRLGYGVSAGGDGGGYGAGPDEVYRGREGAALRVAELLRTGASTAPLLPAEMAVVHGPHPFEPHEALHPGEHVKEYLESYGYSRAELARRSGLAEDDVGAICDGLAPITDEAAAALAEVFHRPAHLWRALQLRYDELEMRAEHAEGGLWGGFEVDDVGRCEECGGEGLEVLRNEEQRLCQRCYVKLHERDCGCGADVAGGDPPARTQAYHYNGFLRAGLDVVAAAEASVAPYEADPRARRPGRG